MNDYYVYIWKTIDTNEVFYVGSGHGIRYKDSDRQSRSPGWWDFFCSHGQKANCTSSILIKGLTKQEALSAECDITKRYREEGHPIVNVNDGSHRPIELQEQINIKLRKPKSEEGRANIARAKQGNKNPMYGKTHEVSEATRTKIGNKMKGNKNAAGRVISAETREKMRKAALAREARKREATGGI